MNTKIYKISAIFASLLVAGVVALVCAFTTPKTPPAQASESSFSSSRTTFSCVEDSKRYYGYGKIYIYIDDGIYVDNLNITGITTEEPETTVNSRSYAYYYQWTGAFSLTPKGCTWSSTSFNAKFAWGEDGDNILGGTSITTDESTALSNALANVNSSNSFDYTAITYTRSGNNFTSSNSKFSSVPLLKSSNILYTYFCVGVLKLSISSGLTAKTYRLSFDFNGGTGASNTINVTYNQTISSSLPTTQRELYIFNGWYINSTRITSSTLWLWASDITAMADWTFTGYTLSTSVSPTGGGAIVDTTTEYAKNSTVKAQAVPESNYTFEYWLLNDERKTANPLSFTITQNSTLVAYFKAIPTITVAFSGGDGAYSNEKIGDTDYLVLTPSSGMYVNSITVGNTTYPTEYYEGVLYGAGNANRITYYAKEETNVVSMSFEYLYGTTNITVNLANTKQTLKTPSYGSKIEGVAVTASNGGEARVIGYTDDDSSIHPSAVPFTGYTFTGWTASNGADLSAYNKLSVNIPFDLIKNAVITATFEPITNQNINDTTDNGGTDIL